MLEKPLSAQAQLSSLVCWCLQADLPTDLTAEL